MIRLAACVLFFSAALAAQQEYDPTAMADSTSFYPDELLDDTLYVDNVDLRRSDVGFFAACGFSAGGGFGDAINADLRDQGYITTGRMIFFDLELGMELKMRDNFYLTPKLSWLHTTLNRRPEYEFRMDDVTIFSMLAGSVGCRYYLSEELPFLYYLQGEAGFMAAASKIAGIPFTSHNISVGALAGYAFCWGPRSVGLEFGYRSIPVSHPRPSVSYSSGRSSIVSENDNRDFGGMFINVVWQFHLANFSENGEE